MITNLKISCLSFQSEDVSLTTKFDTETNGIFNERIYLISTETLFIL